MPHDVSHADKDRANHTHGSGNIGIESVAEEIGRAALPHPFVETVFVGGPLLGDLGTSLVGTDLGTAPFLPHALDVDRWLLATPDGLVHHARSTDPKVVESVDRTRRLADTTSIWDTETTGSVRAGAPVQVAAGDVDPFVAGALGTAAVLVGLGQHVLDATVAYVSEREQFGVPVGSFQAVKHHLADAAKDLAFARPIIHRAAAGLDDGSPTARRDVSMAKALASDAASLSADKALQCHGAIAYTVEFDLHFWLKRIWALSRAWGDARHHRSVVADALAL